MPSAGSFYTATGADTYLASEHCGGPWDPSLQHAGPPEALLAREMLRVAGAPGLALARLTFELLGPLPVGEVRVAASIVRPGRRVQMLEAELEAGDRVAIRARGWQVARAGAARSGTADAPPPRPDTPSFPPSPWNTSGYINALEWRFTHGDFTIGPAGVWARPRFALVDDEPLTGLSRLLLLADSANGIAAPLDLSSWLFIPPETSLHLLRDPEGEWVHLDATTEVSADGPGVARGALSDEHGRVGFVSQALLVAPR